jgi:hypothetical protein
MDARDRKKTPEELAAIAGEIKKQKQAAIDKDALKNVKNGRIIIFVVAGILALSSLVVFYQLDEEPLVFYLYAPFVLGYIALGVFYYKNPYVISIVALTIYLILMIIDAAADPTTIVKGILIKIIVISGLVRAIKYGKDYKVALGHKNTGLLDDELIT